MTHLETDLAESRAYEMRTYLDAMPKLYQNALAQNGEIYDLARAITDDFREIRGEHVLADSRIIKVFRYIVTPSISQMKLGQIHGVRSVKPFEENRVIEGSAKYKALAGFADQLALFVSENFDRQRFRWVEEQEDEISDLELASDYARGWTCGLAADQNAQTRYRNWRKDIQELAIRSELIDLGYVRSSFEGMVVRHTDINIGEFLQERKVRGRTTQKADLVVRSMKSKKLVLIEAKAVGVELDATKRAKECCDKSNDWQSSRELSSPVVVAVVAGFFSPINIVNLAASDIHLVWEHRLNKLGSIL